MNEFADMTGNEFAASRLRSTRLVRSQQIANHSEEPLTMGDTADAVDWRKEGYVTAVKNQGMDGNACHYSATGSLEGQHKKQSGDLVSFSEEQLNECCEECVLSGTVQKCFQWWIKNGGASSEKDYTSWNGRCDDDAPIDSTVRSFTNVEKYSESSLQSAVYNVGPISVSIDASHWSFQVYSSGIYYEPACSETVLDHSVLVVGYDSSGSLNDYWIVKNSWGSSWGQEGYIWMARNANNNCDIASDATYPVV